MGSTIQRRTLVLIVLSLLAALVGTGTAAARVQSTHPPESCRDAHVGAEQYCIAIEQRHALRVVRQRQVREIARTHVKFHRSYYRGWDVHRLRAANRWERQRLQWLKAKPTWWPKAAVPLGRMLAARAGWGGSQWSCLYSLWNRESGWSTPDTNPSSGAAGIPQALPPSKMGPGWETNLRQQIEWGLGYVRARYGSPCAAWAHSNAFNWY